MGTEKQVPTHRAAAILGCEQPQGVLVPEEPVGGSFAAWTVHRVDDTLLAQRPAGGHEPTGTWRTIFVQENLVR